MNIVFRSTSTRDLRTHARYLPQRCYTLYNQKFTSIGHRSFCQNSNRRDDRAFKYASIVSPSSFVQLHGTINFSLFYEQPRKSGKRGRLYAGRGKHLRTSIYIYMYRCTFRESMNRALSHRFSPAILSRHFTFLFVPFQLSRYNWFPGSIDAR